MKRTLIIIFFVLVGIAAGYLYLFKSEISFSNKTPGYKAIPVDAPLFVEINSLKNIPFNSDIIKTLKKSDFLKDFFLNAALIDTLILESKEIVSGLRNDHFIIVINLEGKETITPLIIAKVESNKKKKAIETIISQIFKDNKTVFDKRMYDGRNIFSTNPENPFGEFSYSFTDGLFIASNKSIMVEKSIRQIDSEGLSNSKMFLKANKTATQQAASVYINHNYFPDFIDKYLNPATHKKVNEFGEEIRINQKRNAGKFINYASWSELDLSVNNNDLQFNGVSLSHDSLHQYLSIFEGQEPVKFEVDKILPRNTSVFFSITFSDKEKFFENIGNFFRHNDVYYSREEKLKKIKSIEKIDLKLIFESNIDDEIAMSFINVPGDPYKKNTCFIISTKGKTNAKDEITNWMNNYAIRKGINNDQLVSTFQMDSENNFEIFRFPYPSFPGIWLGTPFNSVSAEFMTFWEDYIIFANSKMTLESILLDLTLETTMAKDIDYIRFKDNIENKTNINFYLNINNAYSLNKEFFSNDISDLFKSNEENLRKFDSFSWQLINTKDICFNNIYLNYFKEDKENAKAEWQSNINNNVDFKPQFVVNHNDPNNKEIIVQDKDHKLNLISNDGRVSWSIDITDKILSEIHQIDYLKNRKLQFLFNTKNKIYLIDRNGNNVSPFPVSMKSPATNGISVFDYDNNRKYRYFVAGEDKKIYVYDGSGKIVTGWKFGKTDHIVKTPVQHFRVGSKDYIVFKDKSRIYVQDRQGQTRLNISAKFNNSKNPIILDTHGTTKMVATDINGEVYYLYFDGKFVQKETPEFSENHFFNVSDIDGNNILDFIFVDKNELVVIDENGKRMFKEEFKYNIEHEPGIYSFDSKIKKIGIVSNTENRIYLYNAEGVLHNGFPLTGNSEFSIGKLSGAKNHLNLIVGSNDGNIYNYRLN